MLWYFRNGIQKSYDILGIVAVKVEEVDGGLYAFEFKWNVKKRDVKCPESFKKNYPDATYKVITPENVEEFLLGGGLSLVSS